MAYTIVKSDGTVLTTIADGTINTTSTTLGLPGRNFSGYGETIDTNFVHQVENFADSTPPAHPLRGQLWFNTTDSTLNVCPSDGETIAANWLTITTSSSGGVTYFDDVVVNGNLTVVGNTTVTDFDANIIHCNQLYVSTVANLAHTNVTGGISVSGSVVANAITTGAQTSPGTMTGTWTVTGGAGGAGANAFIFDSGGIYISNSFGANLFGIKTDKYMYANGTPVYWYSNADVASYLPTYTGTITAGNITVSGTTITGNASVTSNAIISGTLTTGGIKTNGYFYANGAPLSFDGTYTNANVAAYLPTYTGTVGATALSTGASGTAGTITGNWSLSSGSRLNATYADLAERFEADAIYDAGTVVEMGGEKEITAVQYDLSEEVFGVVSDTAAYLMNAAAGSDDTHPAIAVGGRVKVKVIGKVRKGQRLVSAGDGIARAAKPGEATAFNVIGRALAHKTEDQVGIVEAFVSIKG